ncbi:hypothetical protein [Burkholderia cepacia]|uniref:hypothetical protein n=1 Tax=Burkholderia cepacia TaxID=292 RepID=UPI001CF5D3F9|nr:hypothetical protein [Burkholderia cepacia]MCA8075380.1 hypothetical protein [Burkholderia cepacia]
MANQVISAPPQSTPALGPGGGFSEVWWRILVTLIQRTGGAGGVRSDDLKSLVDEILAADFLLTQANKNLPNALVLGAGEGLAESVAGGVLTLSLSVPVVVKDGGTGAKTFTQHSVILGNAQDPLNTAAPAAEGTALVSNGEDSDPSFQAVVNSVEGSSGILVSASTGNVTISLSVPVSVADGGTGATSAAAARANLGAAASGANSDITSISGLTTPLAPTEGGTGVATFTPHGVIVGNGGGPLHATAAGTAGQMLLSGGAAADPAFGSNPKITGGTIDGADVGDTTPAKGAFTQLKNGETVVIHSTVTLANGAGTGAGTLTNAPVAGNPTKWAPIDDNGTTRYMPLW